MIQGSCLCGQVRWQFEGRPDGATACNCTACRRYGVLWAYDYEGHGIRVSGPTTAYVRGRALEFHFCPTCGCVAFWRRRMLDDDGRRRPVLNLSDLPGAVRHRCHLRLVPVIGGDHDAAIASHDQTRVGRTSLAQTQRG